MREIILEDVDDITVQAPVAGLRAITWALRPSLAKLDNELRMAPVLPEFLEHRQSFRPLYVINTPAQWNLALSRF